ncbi:hypothetical protein [Catenuloplanes atrovinosus]|uniref:Uncharacterized protein n=1 Tax=Catenuloplanes atrovinosus TaxID=137266 RepID=A0AAE3YSI8_9ACTN|nr:hypothetical protein [Catenuloplanes atrovinosus]MDR7277638.1 hypothetical protein [Catenuloplanes atrovinosus]
MLDDEQKIIAECVAARREGRPIRDAAARMIASQYHTGQSSPGYAFASTGAITGVGADLHEDLFRGVVIEGYWHSLIPACFADYIDNRRAVGHTGPQPGWSNLWL